MTRGNNRPIRRKVKFAAAAGLTIANSLLLRVGLRRRLDGWRRGAGLLLRGEESTFYLSAFGLDLWSDAQPPRANSMAQSQQHFAERLAAFLAGERDAHVCIRHFPLEDRAEKRDRPCYTLMFDRWVEGPGRFLRPERWSAAEDERDWPRVAGESVVLEFVGRVSPAGVVDVLVRANHVGIDGVPLQDLLTRLEKAWGVKERVVFCSSQEFAPLRQPRACGRSGIAEIQDFVDFSPVLAWRAHENRRLAGPMTFSAALLWTLARHQAFTNLYIGSTVEIPAIEPHGRGVGVVTVRPSDYFSRADGLADYVNDFNREIGLTKRRKSRGCKTLDAAAHVPAALAAVLLGSAIEQGGSAFGSLGLTLVRDARVFGAPMGNPSHADGFIAVGSAALETEDARRVGAVTIKGLAEKIAGYPAILRDAVAQAG